MTMTKTISQVFEEFLADQKTRISHKTFLKYQSIISRYKPPAGNYNQAFVQESLFEEACYGTTDS
jgi:hypothetical protein